MTDSFQNILKDIQIAKLVYYKSCLILLPEIQWCEHPMQQAEQVIFTWEMWKFVLFISTCSGQEDDYLKFTSCFDITTSFSC